MTADRDESLLGRWSRLKRTGGTPPPAEQPPAPPPAVPPDIDLPLPSLDDIKPGADLAAFLKPHVPEALRRAALRKMWSLDPAIRDFREMADYDWDWNIPGGAPGYGPLDPKTDLQALARRVIFGSETPPEADQPKLAHDGEAGSVADAEPAPNTTGSRETAIQPPPAKPASSEAEIHREPSPDRRRHGSAMPS